jgi:putative membrane protein
MSPETKSDRQEVVPMMNGYDMSGWGWLLMTLGMLGFWALVAVLALALLRHPGPPDQQRQPAQQPRPGAEDILAERLARGEIDPEEYRQRLQTLQETISRPTPPLR